MLSKNQIDYAKSQTQRVDKLSIAHSETIVHAHHVEHGVYVLYMDPETHDVLPESFFIEYIVLACLNGRQWPYSGGMMNGQVTMMRHPGPQSLNDTGDSNYLGSAVVERDAPGVESWEEFLFGSK